MSTASMCASTGAGAALDLRVTDEFTAPGESAASLSAVADAPFRAFIEATLAGLDREANFAPAKSPAGLTFVRVALSASGNQVPAVPRALLSSATPGNCTIESPWIEASVSAHGDSISGIVFWNERQLLRDQALLQGLEIQDGPAEAMPRDEFSAMAQLYADARMHDAQPAEGAIPADLLWLFRHAPQSTRGPFELGVLGAMGRLAAGSAEFYGELVANLIASCRTNPGKSIIIKNIKDVEVAIDVERVRTH